MASTRRFRSRLAMRKASVRGHQPAPGAQITAPTSSSWRSISSLLNGSPPRDWTQACPASRPYARVRDRTAVALRPRRRRPGEPTGA